MDVILLLLSVHPVHHKTHINQGSDISEEGMVLEMIFKC
jgi:hypothetical protein